MRQLTSFRSIRFRVLTLIRSLTNAHMHAFHFLFTFWSVFKSMRFGETLSLSRTDTIISRSGSPHDASHLPSYMSIEINSSIWPCVIIVPNYNSQSASRTMKFHSVKNHCSRPLIGRRTMFFSLVKIYRSAFCLADPKVQHLLAG